MNKLTKALLISIALFSLAACGGGGDSDSGSGNTGGGNPGGGNPGGGNPGGGNPGGGNPGDGDPDEGNPGEGDPDEGNGKAVFTFTTSRGELGQAITVNEGESFTISFKADGGTGDENIYASVSTIRNGAIGPISTPEQEEVDGGIKFTFNDVLFKEQTYSIDVTAEKGDDSASVTLDVIASSVKGEQMLAYVNAVNDTLPAQRQFIAEWEMIERLVKGINMSGGDIDIKHIKPLYIRAIHGDGVSQSPEIQLYGVYEGYLFIDEYERGIQGWDDAFREFIDNTSLDTCAPTRCYAEYILRSQTMFNYVFERSGGVIKEPTYGQMGFDAKTNTYSIFYVAPDNGEFDSKGNWTFKPEYEYLSHIIAAGHEAALDFSDTE